MPESRVADPYVTREVTIRDLLVHRTGIEEMDILWIRGFDTRTSLDHMQYATQASSLRSTWACNNTMYVVAAEVVARVAGMSFQEFVRRRIFKPLGMSDSLFSGPSERSRQRDWRALIEQGVARVTEPYLSPDPLGASGIQSSAADNGEVAAHAARKGTFEGKAVVKPETIAEALKPQMLLASIGYPQRGKRIRTSMRTGSAGSCRTTKDGCWRCTPAASTALTRSLRSCPEERLGS